MSDQAVLLPKRSLSIEESFWPKDSLITHILFELWLIMMISPVANFAQQSLVNPLGRRPHLCVVCKNHSKFQNLLCAFIPAKRNLTFKVDSSLASLSVERASRSHVWNLFE